METLAQLLGTVLLAVITGLISYHQSTKKGEQRSRLSDLETEKVVRENRRLSQQVAENDVVIKDMRQQLKSLSHIQVLYDTLKEAHDRLKQDHEDLKAQFEEQSKDWQALKTDQAKKDRKIAELEEQNADLEADKATLVTQCDTFREALRLLGHELCEVKPDANQKAPKSEEKPIKKENHDGTQRPGRLPGGHEVARDVCSKPAHPAGHGADRHDQPQADG